jgi:hypothetical protein
VEIPSPDPRVALVAGVAAGVASPRVRRVVGTGIGYAARGVMTLGAPLAGAGRDIYASAREVASGDRPASGAASSH